MLRVAVVSRVVIAGVMLAALGLGVMGTWQAVPQVSACHGVDPKTGDLNADGATNSIDALLVMDYQAGLMPAPSKLWMAGADVNCDSAVNAIDASLILQVGAGLYHIRP